MAKTKTTDVYEVTMPRSRTTIFVEAQGKQEAKAIAHAQTTVTKLSGREVRDIIAAGKTIIDGSEPLPTEPEDPTTKGQGDLLADNG